MSVVETPFVVFRDPEAGFFTQLSILEVCEMQRQAAMLVEEASKGDATAQAILQNITASVTQAGPGRGRSVIAAYLVRDALEQKKKGSPPIVASAEVKSDTVVTKDESVASKASASPAQSSKECEHGFPKTLPCTFCEEEKKTAKKTERAA